MGPLCCLWAHLDYLKKDNEDNEGVIDLNMLIELVAQCLILVGQCHSRGLYFRWQRVLTALFRERGKVKSLLKEGAHCFAQAQKVLFGKTFNEKKIKKNKTKKTKDLLKEYSKPTPAKCHYHYGSRQSLF